MSSQHSYCGGMEPKIYAKREQTIVYQCDNIFLCTNANKNLRHLFEDVSSDEREQKSS